MKKSAKCSISRRARSSASGELPKPGCAARSSPENTMLPASERWARIKEVFDAAADLPPSDRALLLSQECDGDDALRREVQALLDSDAQTDGFIEQPVLEIPRDLFPPAPEEESVVGREFGAYRVVREIGRGGLGTVYLAA